MNKIKPIKLTAITFVLLACACSPKIENRGYVKPANWKDSIIVGQTSKQEILDKFGSPSSQSSFGEETWYYVYSRKEAFGFMKPSVVEQEAASISFNNAGTVSSINIHNENDAKYIELVKRTTPTEGHTLNFLDQTIGNLGRFNKPTGDGNSAAPGRRPPSRGGF